MVCVLWNWTNSHVYSHENKLFLRTKGAIIAQTPSYYSATGAQGAAVCAPVIIDQDHKQAELGHFLRTATVPWFLIDLPSSPLNKSVFALKVRLNARLEDSQIYT